MKTKTKIVAKKSVAKKPSRRVRVQARIAKLEARMKAAVAKNAWRVKKIAALKAKLKTIS